MRIAFYCELEKLKNKLVAVDLEGGNPGIGGTQYLFLLTVKYLNEIYGENYCILLTDTKIDLQENKIKDTLESIKDIKEIDEIIVVDDGSSDKTSEVAQSVKSEKRIGSKRGVPFDHFDNLFYNFNCTICIQSFKIIISIRNFSNNYIFCN